MPVLVLLLAVGTGCVSTGTNPVSGNTRAYGYSWQEEVTMGQKADKQIQGQYGVYDDEELQEYVDGVAQEVLAESHMRRPDTPERFRNTEFEFRVLDSPIINAFALPGGYVYVTRGLVAHLNNEAQLAMVLGHEIGHVAARHASQQAARQKFTQGLLLSGAVAGQVAFGGNVAENVMGLGGQAAQLLSLSYSRDNERESDRLGVEYAVRAGYDGAEGAAFFESLERVREQGGQSIPTWQSTHPDPGARQQTIPELAQTWRKKVDRPATTIDQDAYYNALEGTVLGKNPRQGFVEEGVFYQPELAFRFSIPSRWDVQNQPQQVALVQPDQSAYMIFTFSDAETPDAAARKFAGQDGLSVLDRQSTSVNGNDARRVLAEGKTQQGQVVRLLTYFIAYGDNVYQFQGATSADQYDAYRPDFERTMTSFARLTDSEKLNRQPARIAIQAADREGAFRSFVDTGALPSDMTEEDLAIINQLEVDQVVAPDRPLKLPN
ncbi:putative Zn-dependent protease [Salinibacter ruber]|uniref:M48 family metalloprotease n=1 Tax=Salinibacter ruber TaxID=146919 RepID=UPI001F084D0C|nr:M48 family metallopeptidase [Salinibacter ruber]MCS3669206.1 putative Zn-dependent protease [Salinibacter ruber]